MATNQTVLNINDDSFVTSTTPGGNNGSVATLSFGQIVPIFMSHMIMKVDLYGTPASGPTITGTPTISSATLDLTIQSASTLLNLVAYRVTEAWEESQVTWVDRITATAWTTAGGDYDTGVTDDLDGINDATGRQSRPLTNIVSDAIQNRSGLASFIIVPASGSAICSCHSAESTSSSDRPQLTVNWAGTDIATKRLDIRVPSRGSLRRSNFAFRRP